MVCTALTSAPAAMRSDAAVWRRSWIRVPAGPTVAVVWVHFFPSRVGVDAVKSIDLGGSPTVCFGEGVTATSEDGAWAAEMPGPICDGDAWVIEQSDLEPVDTGGG